MPWSMNEILEDDPIQTPSDLSLHSIRTFPQEQTGIIGIYWSMYWGDPLQKERNEMIQNKEGTSQTLTWARGLSEPSLKTSHEQFTPDISTEGEDETHLPSAKIEILPSDTDTLQGDGTGELFNPPYTEYDGEELHSQQLPGSADPVPLATIEIFLGKVFSHVPDQDPWPKYGVYKGNPNTFQGDETGELFNPPYTEYDGELHSQQLTGSVDQVSLAKIEIFLNELLSHVPDQDPWPKYGVYKGYPNTLQGDGTGELFNPPYTEYDEGELHSQQLTGSADPMIQAYSSRDPASISKASNKLWGYDQNLPTATDTRQGSQGFSLSDLRESGTIKPPKILCSVPKPVTNDSGLNPSGPHPPDPDPWRKNRKYQQLPVDPLGKVTRGLLHLSLTDHEEEKPHSQQFTGSLESSFQYFYTWSKDKEPNMSNQFGEKKLGSTSHSGKGVKCEGSVRHSHSSPSLTHMTSAEGQTLTRARSLPELLLKTSYEQFTPDISTDGEDETYRFHCSRSGLYQCMVTGLLFQMEREGDVVYRTVPWDWKLLSQHHKQPAGPLFEISCEQQSVCQLHLPHCEILSTGGDQHLSVAHVNQEGMEFIVPHKITETHVIINISSFSGFGIMKDEDCPSVPIRALVLLFYRPPVDPDPSSVLNVLLLPKNVVLRDVQRIRKKTVGDERYIETSPHCKLQPQQDYTLSTCPEDSSVLVDPTTAEFDCEDYDNYFPSFQVNFQQTMKHIQLSLKHTSSSISVWDRRVCLQSSGVQRSCGQSALNLPPSKRLLDIRSSFIERVSGPVLKSLLDKLFDKTVMAESERESADGIPNRRDKARFVIDTVRKKGEAASTEMMEALCEIDPFLSEHLGLI